MYLCQTVLNVPACALRSSLPNSCTYIMCSLLSTEVEYCVFCVQITLFLGQLNAIAPIVTMFFLVSYCVVNLACLALKLAAAPNFRYDEQHCGPVHVLCICGHVLLYTWELLTDCLHVHVYIHTLSIAGQPFKCILVTHVSPVHIHVRTCKHTACNACTLYTTHATVYVIFV